MKKSLLLLAFLCFSAFQIHAQALRWGTQSFSSGNVNVEQTMDMCADSSGNTYSIGYFNDTATFGAITLYSRGGRDVFVMKNDSMGNVIWAKSFGYPGTENGNGIAVDISGNVYITGDFNSRIYFSPTDSLVTSGNIDIWVAKLDMNGNLLLKMRAGGTGADHGNAIAVNNINGNFAIVGDQYYNENFLLIKYNSAGTILFTKIFPATYAFGSGVSFDNNDLLYTSAYYNGNMTCTPATSIVNQGGKDGIVLVFSSSGTTIVQSKGYGGASEDYIYDIKSAPDGSNFYVAGSFKNSNWIIGYDLNNNPVTLVGSNSSVFAFVEKAQLTNYRTIWAKVGIYFYPYTSLDIDKYNNVFVTSDRAIHKYSSTGVYDWQAVPSGILGGLFNRAISCDKYGNAYVAGYYNGTNLGFGDSTLSSPVVNSALLYKSSSVRITSPLPGYNICVSPAYNGGDSIHVTFSPTMNYNAGNIFTLQLDTFFGNFSSPVILGTMTTGSGGTFHAAIPYGTPNTGFYIRIVSSSPASLVGDRIFLNTHPRPYAWYQIAPYTRCPEGAPSTIQSYSWNTPTNPLTYLWSTSATTSMISVSPTVNTTYTVTTTDTVTGCVGIDTVQVRVFPSPTVTAGNDFSICRGSSDTLHASGTLISTYLWAPTTNMTGATTANPVIVPTANTSYTCTVTSADGCTAKDTISVISALTTVNASPVSYNTCFGSAVPLSATGTCTASPANHLLYSWSPAASLNDAVIANPIATPPATTMYRLTATDSIYGCSASDSVNIIVGPIVVNANDIAITCANSGTLTAVSTGNYVLPLTYLWTPSAALSSTTTATTTASPINSTTYHVTLTTGNGCSGSDSAIVTVNPASFNLAFSAAQQLLSSPPFVGQFTNSTPNLSNYTFTWYWGDGNFTQSNNATVFHTYAYNGNYDVTLVAVSNATGCSNTLFQGGYIFCTGGTGCTVTATVSTPQGTTTCMGDSLLLTCNTSASYTYQWNLNGLPISGATTSSYYATVGGNYSVSIGDGSCTVISPQRSLSFTSPPASPTITQAGNFTTCASGTVFLNASSGYTSYLWSTGATTQNINVTASGIYSVSVTTGNGSCPATASYTVNASVMAPPSICAVSVDTVLNHNLVVWEHPVTTQIDSFIIYREGIIANQFDRIGAVDYTAFTTFTDVNSNPAQQSYRYELGIRDSCGVLSALSPYHKTIHLTINQGVGNVWNLLWNGYEGFNFSTYNIYRGPSVSNMTLLTSIASTNLSYSDLTPPIGWVYYQIEAVNPSGCNPSMHAINYGSSVSNVVDNGGEIVTGTITPDQSNFFTLHPNPATNDLVISFVGAAANGIKTIELVNTLGQVVLTKQISNTSVDHLDLSAVSNGVYLVKIKDGTSEAVQRLIISK